MSSTSVRLLVIAALLLFAACGGNLSPGEAERLISAKLRLPAARTTEIPRLALNRAWSAPSGGGFMPAVTICQDLGTQWSDVRHRIEEYRDRGLVTLGEKTDSNGRCNYEYTVIELTEEGRRYLVSEAGNEYLVRTHTIGFGEITGIQTLEQVKIAEAKYTLVVQETTPFARETAPAPESRSAAFRRFDDGWRIEE